MKKKLLLPHGSFLIIAFTVTVACQKGVEKPKEEKKETVSIVQSPKWNANDDKYVASIKEFTRKFHAGTLNRASNYCISGTVDSTYGWFSDPDSCIESGPYVVAKAGTYETDVQNCSSVDTLVGDASTYLTNEGYSDFVSLWGNSLKKHWLIHAANVLVDLKEQYNAAYSRINVGRQTTLWHCLLEAVGATALAGLAYDWATMSRQAIMQAVGKLASKYLSWVGAIVAVITFVDCMWG